MLELATDTVQLPELQKALSLIKAANIDKKLDVKELKKMLFKAKDTKEKNERIIHAYQEGILSI